MSGRYRNRRHHDDYDSDDDHQYSRGRDRAARPRAQKRSSSYDGGYSYGHRPQSTGRYYYNSSDDDSDDLHHDYHNRGADDRRRRSRPSSPRGKGRTQSGRPRPRHRQTKSAGHSPSPPPRTRSRTHKSRKHRDRSESPYSDEEWDQEMARQKKNQAIRSALTAGAVEAMRQRNRPGDWLGAKGMRVATAAMSAAAIDTARGNPSKRSTKSKMMTSALGGLFVDKLASSVSGR